MIPPRLMSGAVALAAAAAVLAPASALAAKKPAAPGKKAAPQYYVSLGDSYASGYQPPAAGSAAGNTREGFVYQVPGLAAKRGWKLRVVNFACGGATTSSLLTQKDCPKAALGPGAKGYGAKTQIQAAEAFLKKNRKNVGLITISIGGNDVTRCATEAVPVTCVAGAIGPLRENVRAMAKRLRKAAGPKVRIVGTTYPDVILGAYLAGPAGQGLATLSLTAFRSFLNQALEEEYGNVGGKFVDVTTATGAYTPFTETTTVEGLGTIPVAVAKVCELTWYCAAQDIHARKNGYTLIADLVARTLPKGKQFKK